MVGTVLKEDKKVINKCKRQQTLKLHAFGHNRSNLTALKS